MHARGRCPHCLSPTRFERAASFTFLDLIGDGARWDVQDNDDIYLARENDPVFDLGYVLSPLACAFCGGVVVVARQWREAESGSGPWWVVLPRYAARPVPAEVQQESPDIAADFEEAAAVLPISAKASAALSRRCLQALLADKAGAQQKNLSKQIDAVLPKLPTELAKDLDAVRQIGNFAAHPQKEMQTGSILDVEPHEAEWTLEVLEGLFDLYYVQPARSAARRQELNEKLKKAGKPPMKDLN